MSITVKIELKSKCELERTFGYCLNNRYGYASTSPDSANFGTSCDDNSTSLEVPIKGDIGASETCKLAYNAEAYYIEVFNITEKECYYEISYN
jgi:hypothetical protein